MASTQFPIRDLNRQNVSEFSQTMDSTDGTLDYGWHGLHGGSYEPMMTARRGSKPPVTSETRAETGRVPRSDRTVESVKSVVKAHPCHQPARCQPTALLTNAGGIYRCEPAQDGVVFTQADEDPRPERRHRTGRARKPAARPGGFRRFGPLRRPCRRDARLGNSIRQGGQHEG